MNAAVEMLPSRRYALLSATEIAQRKPLAWRIKRILPAEGVAAIYGSPGSGKSFLALDMLGAIAAGRDWFGFRTKASKAVYLGLEGEAGLAQRVRAYVEKHGRSDGLRFATGDWDVADASDRNALIHSIKSAGMAGGVLVIDTLSRAAPGLDENSSEGMGAITAGLHAVQRALGGLVIAIHHGGKDQSRGLRGHSSLLGTLDVVIEVTRHGSSDQRTWKVAKSKDGGDCVEVPFSLSAVHLEDDEDGDEITSCVVSEEAQTAAGSKPVVPSGKHQKAALKVIRDLIDSGGQIHKPASQAASVKAIEYESALDAVAASIAVGVAKRKRERAALAICGLISGKFLERADGFIWVSDGLPVSVFLPVPLKGETGKTGTDQCVPNFPKKVVSGKTENPDGFSPESLTATHCAERP